MRRGMRLADTLFLTLGIACLQVYVGMRCSSAAAGSCMYTPLHGFDWLLAASVATSLASAALCFMGLEMNDHRRAASARCRRARPPPNPSQRQAPCRAAFAAPGGCACSPVSGGAM